VVIAKSSEYVTPTLERMTINPQYGIIVHIFSHIIKIKKPICTMI